ncbi:hypothetical protein [Novosphingobium sp.]|uniref:hypothetical protein n=1 Tax=Novosphingobium sp. TaxID=1874826 RepID=UPI003B5172B1
MPESVCDDRALKPCPGENPPVKIQTDSRFSDSIRVKRTSECPDSSTMGQTLSAIHRVWAVIDRKKRALFRHLRQIWLASPAGYTISLDGLEQEWNKSGTKRDRMSCAIGKNPKYGTNRSGAQLSTGMLQRFNLFATFTMSQPPAVTSGMEIFGHTALRDRPGLRSLLP